MDNEKETINAIRRGQLIAIKTILSAVMLSKEAKVTIERYQKMIEDEGNE